jgi:putative membrane protein
MDRLRHIFLAGTIMLVAGPSYAQQSPIAAAQFAPKAAIGDMFEIQSSELALQKSQNTDVQTFASKIIQDHRANSEEMKALLQKSAAGQPMELPTALDKPHHEKLEQLRSASSRFEGLYRTAQIQAHEEAIKMFEDYARAGDNADLKTWAGGKVPVLRGHLQMAQALPQQTSTSPTASAAPSGQAPTSSATQHEMRALASPGKNHIMASDLEGTTVRSATDENIGEIDDVVLDRDGRVVAVIVGVGGFLGLGEKAVAIPFSALEIVSSNDGYMAQGTPGSPAAPAGNGNARGTGTTGTTDPKRVVLRGMTKADLERAPEFKANGGT